MAGNSAQSGGVVSTTAGTVELLHSTLAANTTTAGSHIEAANLTSTASVVAEPLGPGANCALTNSTTSSGYNYDDDGTCGFGAGTGDVSNGDAPLLGQARHNGDLPAAAEAGGNGTPRPTMLPLNGSPLIDAIPVGSCSVVAGLDLDQQGLPRPFGTGCDIGAIEAVFPAHDRSDVTPFYEPTVRWITSTVNTPQILNGFDNGTFGQTLNITRGQTARMYYRAAGEPDVSGFPPHELSDVTSFFEDAVTWAKKEGIFDGINGQFLQANPISRGNFTRSLYGFAGMPSIAGLDPHGFGDVTNFYATAVTWAKANGLADGFTADNTFRQTLNINRGNVSRITYNLAQSPDAWEAPETAPPNMLFKDNLTI